ncbi:MAG TPA: Stk1 family PASTA domain-containing Ser/Thr kinase [Actinomycetota bacterium]|nr:Stk1 family PASTA domain-containing Ser/Thr kinase [Actinomycetota bacterium]
MRRLEEAPSEIAGRYVIAGRIGSGGMGEVFRARDSVLGRTVAIKMLPFELAIQPGFVERFKAEAQAVARISHPNVVQVHDWGQENDTYYMVMEYIRGKNLRQVLSSAKRLHPRQAAQVTGQVLGALAAAHEKGVVHRDVKPENVVVATDGRVKVADFGIARAAESAALTGGMLGTVAYVAPEQARGDDVDARTDLYSTGCMLYELLTGSLPFEGDAAKVLQDHLNSRVPAPSVLVPEVGEGLDRIVLKATAPKPSDRYRSAADMRKDLGAVLASLPEAPPLSALTEEFTSEASPDNVETVIRQAPPRRKKGRRKWVIAAVLVAALVGGVWYIGPTQVPPLAGEPRAVAEERIAQAGLQARFADVFSDDVPMGEVVTSRPGAGSWTTRDGTVSVSVSAGPKLSDVPDVVGMDLEQARTAILENDLAIGKVDRQHSLQPVDHVLSQDPGPKQVKSGELVTLVVSDGPAILPLPDLSGKSADAAEALLREQGFTSERSAVFNAAAAGTVIGQSPPAGEPHQQGTQVTISVSRGPQPFQVPEVKGKPCSEAKGQLEGLGMRVVTQTSGGGEATCGANRVLEQDPLPQSQRTPGAEATLYVG